MSDWLYCYRCRTCHPRDQMLLFQTKTARRWRCRRSVEAAQEHVEARDRFGRQQTAINRGMAARQAEYAGRLSRERRRQALAL